MGKQHIEELLKYLMRLAPSFFSSRMRGASPEEIAELEKIANRHFCDSYRAFLSVMGRTPAQALNPFLNDRDFEIDTIKRAYEEARERVMEDGLFLPDSVIFFSASDILGENIFLRQPTKPDGDLEIGDLRWVTGEFIIWSNKTLENWLFSLSFWFRLAQLDHLREFCAPWSEKDQTWKGQPERYLEIMANLGFKIVFEFPNGFVCHERGDMAAIAHTASTSGDIACDDVKELERISAILADNLNLSLSYVPDRLRAPKK